MSKRITCVVVVSLLLVLWPAAAVAEEGKGQRIALLQEAYVHPEKSKEYEALIAEVKEAAAIHGMTSGWDLYKIEDLRYLTFRWIEGTAGIDALYAEWDAFGERWGEEKFVDWHQRVWATMDHMKVSVWRPRADLSYVPENQSDAYQYIVWGLVPFKPGHRQEVEDLFAEYVKVFAEHEVPHAWSAASGCVGTDYPILSFVEWAASPGSYWIRHDEAMENEELSAKTNALWEKMMPHIRGFDWVSGWYLKELSYKPGKKEAEEE